jgi:hypothetical protein
MFPRIVLAATFRFRGRHKEISPSRLVIKTKNHCCTPIIVVLRIIVRTTLPANRAMIVIRRRAFMSSVKRIR